MDKKTLENSTGKKFVIERFSDETNWNDEIISIKRSKELTEFVESKSSSKEWGDFYLDGEKFGLGWGNGQAWADLIKCKC